MEVNTAHTSKVWPQSDIIPLQQFIHRLLHERHVARFIDAGKKQTKKNKRETSPWLGNQSSGTITLTSLNDKSTHLFAQHTIEPTTSAENTRNWRTLCRANITPFFSVFFFPCLATATNNSKEPLIKSRDGSGRSSNQSKSIDCPKRESRLRGGVWGGRKSQQLAVVGVGYELWADIASPA